MEMKGRKMGDSRQRMQRQIVVNMFADIVNNLINPLEIRIFVNHPSSIMQRPDTGVSGRIGTLFFDCIKLQRKVHRRGFVIDIDHFKGVQIVEWQFNFKGHRIRAASQIGRDIIL